MIIKIVSVSPGKMAEIKQVCSDFEILKAELGASYYEMIYPFEDKSIALIRNELAEQEGSPANRVLYNSDGTVNTIIKGKFLIVGTNEDDIRTLTDNEIQTYYLRFQYPESFYQHDGKFCVERFEPHEDRTLPASQLLADIWEGKYKPQNECRDDEQQKRERRMNKALQEMLCVLPENMNSLLDAFVVAVSSLHRYEKMAAYQSGVEFGREMYNATQ